MTATVFVRVCGPGQDPLVEYLDGDSGEPLRGTIDAISEQLRARPKNADLVLIVPMEDVLSVSVVVPSRQKRKIRQALPYMVEELLFVNVESAHIAILGRSEPNTVHVAVVAHERVKTWQALCGRLGLKWTFVLPDALLLPQPANTSALHADSVSGRVLARLSQTEGFATSPEVLPFFLAAAKARDYSFPETSVSEPLLRTLREEFNRDPEGYTRMNLLQQNYSAAGSRVNLRNWFVPLARVACAVLLAQVVFNLASGYFIREQARVLQNEATALYGELFPMDTRIVNIRTQMQAHIDGLVENSGLSGRASFQNLLAEIADALTEGMEIQSIRYNGSGSQMSLEIKANTYAQFDAMQKTLGGRGLDSEIVSATQDGDTILGRLNISVRG